MIRRGFSTLLLLILTPLAVAQERIELQAARPPLAGGLELNTRPIQVVSLKTQLVEVSPAGIRKKATWATATALVAGSSSETRFALAGSAPLTIQTELLSLTAIKAQLRLRVVDKRRGQTLGDRTLTLEDRQEVIVEFAESAAGNSRLAVSLLPEIRVKPAIVDYPTLAAEFGVWDAILIRNRRQILSRSAAISENRNLTPEIVQLLTISNEWLGSLWLSYRPFPGSVLAGYVEGNKILFEWDGALYEWISLRGPILGEGKWALYIRQASPPVATYSPYSGTAIGAWDRPLSEFSRPQ